MKPKGKGSVIMVSDFIDGFLALNNEENYILLLYVHFEIFSRKSVPFTERSLTMLRFHSVLLRLNWKVLRIPLCKRSKVK